MPIFLQTKTEDMDRVIEMSTTSDFKVLKCTVVKDQNGWIYVGVPEDDDVPRVTNFALFVIDSYDDEGKTEDKFDLWWDLIRGNDNLHEFDVPFGFMKEGL